MTDHKRLFTAAWTKETVRGREIDVLRSNVQVEDLFAAHPERALLALVIMDTPGWMLPTEEEDAKRFLWGRMVYLHDQGRHSGDCTNLPCSCSRCIAEGKYEEVCDFEEQAAAVDGAADLDWLAVILATNELQPCERDVVTRMTSDAFDFDYTPAKRHADWRGRLTDEQRTKAGERATKWRHWLMDGKPPPYPKDWPEHWDE